ncbi:hypothetical protein B0H13DRAFT_2348972 [Mycena leptocephala]|nr:hypothetical protein B0H13DRAFT_2348972 [Mycena leptocephala]
MDALAQLLIGLAKATAEADTDNPTGETDGSSHSRRKAVSILYEPYANNHHTQGFMRLAPQVLFEFIPQFLRDGWQVNVHATGDRANGIVLDAFEMALKEVNVTVLRPRLEHTQLITKEDTRRLGVTSSVQPMFSILDDSLTRKH